MTERLWLNIESEKGRVNFMIEADKPWDASLLLGSGFVFGIWVGIFYNTIYKGGHES